MNTHSPLQTSVMPDQSMEALRFYAPGDVRLETMPVPTPEAGELVIKVEAALTCGTDLKTYRRGHPVLLKSFPSPFGHEGAGTVVALGEGVEGFRLGDRVVPANSAPCMDCYYCQKQQFNLCQHLDLLNGTYAQYMKIPAPIVARNTLVVPNHVPFEQAAFSEPLAVSLRGVEGCKIHPGDHVAVIGLGTIGQFLVKLAKLAGAHVTGFGRNPLKCHLAMTFGGADQVLALDSIEDMPSWLKANTPSGEGFDVVIEAVGQPAIWEQAIVMVRRGGLVNLFGGCERGTHINVDTRRLHYDEITLISLFHYTPRHFKDALALIASGQVDPSPLISDSASLAGLTHALEEVSLGRAVKVAIFPHRT